MEHQGQNTGRIAPTTISRPRSTPPPGPSKGRWYCAIPITRPTHWTSSGFRRNRTVPQTAAWNSRGLWQRHRQLCELVNGKPTPVQLEDHETETKVTLPTPLKPGSTATFQVAWHFIVPVTENRMGRHGSLYQIAQWYPRLNVYDDVKGWNTEPYLGLGEFFLEYGDFTLR